MKQTEILLTIKLHQELFIDPKRVRLLKKLKNVAQSTKQPKTLK